ncbi:hypothetical protein KIPB_009747 [Kipferlia bialata]|uniref:Uncharacterized protein n=1 Tax=Kipferlia bialata TaxID=797122 RepID=A0A9K3GMH6_9EUKA|nr:hypothetical protein KIPB_009747 [Kipferlia bialata]|eukprot:g9747.t1
MVAMVPVNICGEGGDGGHGACECGDGGHGACVHVGRHIVVIGGTGDWYKCVRAYDTVSATWEDWTRKARGFKGGRGGSAVLVGGSEDGGHTILYQTRMTAYVIKLYPDTQTE